MGFPSSVEVCLACKLMQKACELYSKQLWKNRTVLKYLRGRGFADETLKAFNIGYAPRQPVIRQRVCAGTDEQETTRKVRLACEVGLLRRPDDAECGYFDFMRERIVFPIRWPDEKGKFRCVGFGGRSLDPRSGAKYLNTKTTFLYNKSAVVYGLDLAYEEILRTGIVVLVEGYTDCVALHQAGVKNAVAASGTAFTDEHAQILAMYAKSARVVMDGDAAGKSGGSRAVAALKDAGTEAVPVHLPDGLDPADFVAERGGRAFAGLVE